MDTDRQSKYIFVTLLFVTVVAMVVAVTSTNHELKYRELSGKMGSPTAKKSSAYDEVRDGIHLPTGLIADTDFELVVANCTACHAAEVLTQNRLTGEGWTSAIRWMQESQGLWDLGKNEEKIVAYLARNYSPQEHGRRKQLKLNPGDWYVLTE